MKGFILFVVTVALLMAGQLNATVIFNTFGPGDSYDLYTGWTLGVPDVVTANQFTVPLSSSYYFDKIELAVGMVTGTNQLDIQLVTSDGAGLPGSIIEAFHFSGAMGTFGQSNPPLVAYSASHPVLNAGTDYWFVASVPMGEWSAWNFSSPRVNGYMAQKWGTSPWNKDFNTLSAFRVSGTAIPEPSTVLLLGTGLLGLFGYGWRRKRQN